MVHLVLPTCFCEGLIPKLGRSSPLDCPKNTLSGFPPPPTKARNLSLRVLGLSNSDLWGVSSCEFASTRRQHPLRPGGSILVQDGPRICSCPLVTGLWLKVFLPGTGQQTALEQLGQKRKSCSGSLNLVVRGGAYFAQSKLA